MHVQFDHIDGAHLPIWLFFFDLIFKFYFLSVQSLYSSYFIISSYGQTSDVQSDEWEKSVIT